MPCGVNVWTACLLFFAAAPSLNYKIPTQNVCSLWRLINSHKNNNTERWREKNVSITAASFSFNQNRNYCDLCANSQESTAGRLAGTTPREKQKRSSRRPSSIVTFTKKKNLLPSIFNVPLWTITKRFLVCTAAPSFDHLMLGAGLPAARQLNIATLPFGRVWFVGPIWMMGGGMSSTDVTWKRREKWLIWINICVDETASFQVLLARGKIENIWSTTSSFSYHFVYLLRSELIVSRLDGTRCVLHI